MQIKIWEFSEALDLINSKPHNEMVSSRHVLPSWITAASRVGLEGNADAMLKDSDQPLSDVELGVGERTLSAAGAAILSAIIVNPLDVAKTRLQAQAAGVPYEGSCAVGGFETNKTFQNVRSSKPCARSILGSEQVCPPECIRYSGTVDVFYKVIRQEGFTRLWRGTNASLALAVPTVGIYLPCYDIFRNLMENYTTVNAPALTPYVPLAAGTVARSLACITCYPVELARTRMQAFRDTENGIKPAGVWKTLVEVANRLKTKSNTQNVQSYRILWTGLGAQLARDVPFSAICWPTLEPIRKELLAHVGDEATAGTVLGANFAAGFVAGSLAAAMTCPLDVARTRRQIEKDPLKASKMNTRLTLLEIWRDGGARGLFTGIVPRVGRAGPSVGIVVSFYEVVKHALHLRREDG